MSPDKGITKSESPHSSFQLDKDSKETACDSHTHLNRFKGKATANNEGRVSLKKKKQYTRVIFLSLFLFKDVHSWIFNIIREGDEEKEEKGGRERRK